MRPMLAILAVCSGWMLGAGVIAPCAALAGGDTLLRIGNGYNVTINTQWLDGFGYRPVRIVIQPTTPLVADQTITVRVQAETYYSMAGGVTVEQDILIPRVGAGGVSQGEAIVRVPVYDGWQQLNIRFFQHGRELPRLAAYTGLNMSLGSNRYWNGTSMTSMNMLVVDSASILRGGAGSGMGTNGSGATTLEDYQLVAIHPRELATSWLDLTGIDVVTMSIDELQSLTTSHPETFRALKDWVYSGGSLWVCKTQADLSTLPELNELLSLSDVDANSTEHGWRTTDSVRAMSVSGVIDLGGKINVPALDTGQSIPRGPDDLAITSVLRWRPVGFGSVAAIPNSLPQNGGPEWTYILEEIRALPRSWTARHGISPYSGSEDYWNFMIPGVGLPPVILFEILITLFVILIGPINYLVLKRRRRLHLLVVTVPAVALVITTSLFVYALISDGLGTRVMARSFTYLDQRQNQAACWSRLSYYSGLAPSGGLNFSQDVAVYPLAAQSESFMPNGPTRSTFWGETQRLGTGWLASRTPMQLLTVRSRTSTYKLDITENAGSAPSARNLLGSPVLALVLCDSSGKIFAGEDIGMDQTATLQEIMDPVGQLRRLRDGIANSMPPPVSGPDRNGYVYSGMPWANNSGEELDAAFGLLELHIGAAARLLSNPPALPPNSYIAVVEKSAECQLGLESAAQESSFHIIYGRW